MVINKHRVRFELNKKIKEENKHTRTHTPIYATHGAHSTEIQTAFLPLL